MNLADLEHLRALRAAGSPGIWRAGYQERHNVFVPHPHGIAGSVGERVVLQMNRHSALYTHDVLLVAAAVNALDPLVGMARQSIATINRPDDDTNAVQHGAVRVASNVATDVFARQLLRAAMDLLAHADRTVDIELRIVPRS